MVSRYLGIDYSTAMSSSCRRRFPDLDFRLADASDLSAFENESFDAVVFSFNGLDSVVPNENRSRCFRECWRVLRPAGVFIFSSHNPRSVLVRADWDRGRLHAFARRFVSQRNVCFPLVVAVLTAGKTTHAFLSAAIRGAVKMIQRLPSSAFWHGEGDLFDSSHGGLLIHCSIPNRVIAELNQFDFQLLRLMGYDYPQTSRALLTDWYYYVFTKTDNHQIGRKSCA